jgi:chemotaxis protein methyltransferase CheR
MMATSAALDTELAEGDFEFLRAFLLERSAHALAPDKHYLVTSRLRPVARELGVDSLAELLAHMRETRDATLESKVIEAMTTNETLWFRDVKPFKALRNEVFPEIIKRNEPARRLAVWSAASSSGQELYSVAMLLAHDFPQLDSWSLTLKGTDINTAMLERARQGRFSGLEINRGLPADYLASYFARDGAHYVIKETLRKKVSFSHMNLAGTWPILPKFDVILLRNVLIYFDHATKARIIEAAAKQLAPGGYLFLGSAETLFGTSTGLISRNIEGTTAYQNGAA